MNKNTKKIKLNERNSKILHETLVTLGALKEGSDALQEMAINEIQVHLLDDSGDGIILCLEYETSDTGELNKTFSTSEEYYADEDDDVHLDAVGDYDPPHTYYDEEDNVELDPCNSPENVKEVLNTMIEETISEEYDEIFQERSRNKKPPPLLN